MNSLRVLLHSAMAVCLGLMALLVFVNVVLRYGFGSGVAASDELSRLLFVWMVFLGATAAYPAGEHMAFTSLANRFKGRTLVVWTALVRGLVILAASLVCWGAWQQVLVGMDSKSVVLGYPTSMLPLPAFLCSLAIALMAAVELVRGKPLDAQNEVHAE